MKFKHTKKLNEFLKNNERALLISNYEDLINKGIYIGTEKEHTISFIVEDDGVFAIVTAYCVGDDLPLHTAVVFIAAKDVKYMNSRLA